MLFTNASIFLGERGFAQGGFTVSGNLFGDILTGDREKLSLEEQQISGREGDFTLAEETVDLEEAFVLPGLVDIHTHGNSGHDFSDGSLEGLRQIGRYLACHGITSFLPTSMTLPYERLEQAFRTAACCDEDRPKNAARVLGIHMEGPYLSEKKKGAQNSAFMRLPDIDGFMKLQAASGDRIRIVDIAPEREGAEAFIRAAASSCKVSVAHTDASYEEAVRAFEAGASHVTHLFNAMPPLHHREPGVIAAAALRENVAVELICDGLHVHPAMVRLAFRLFPGRVCLISDSLRCCGMPDGAYELGGQMITVRAGQARLSGGNLAGAVSNLYDDMINAIRFGIPAKDAIMAATIIPAREAGADDQIGSIETGKRADFIVCDRAWNLKQVYVDGIQVRDMSVYTRERN